MVVALSTTVSTKELAVQFQMQIFHHVTGEAFNSKVMVQ
jgi:hypothetical protein